MEKTTQKELKRLVRYGNCEDITHLGFDEINALRDDENGLGVQMVSHGVYGMNGALLKGNRTGKMYVITTRTSALFQLV